MLLPLGTRETTASEEGAGLYFGPRNIAGGRARALGRPDTPVPGTNTA